MITFTKWFGILKATSFESMSVLGTGHLRALGDCFQNTAANKKLKKKKRAS